MSRAQNAAELRGHYREDSGALVPGSLYLRRDAGGWYDPEMDFPGLPPHRVTARAYRITPDMTGVEIIGCGGQPFLPADGECERIGLPILAV